MESNILVLYPFSSFKTYVVLLTVPFLFAFVLYASLRSLTVCVVGMCWLVMWSLCLWVHGCGVGWVILGERRITDGLCQISVHLALFLFIPPSNTHKNMHTHACIHTDRQKHCAAGHSGYGLLSWLMVAKVMMPGNLDHACFNSSHCKSSVQLPGFKGPKLTCSIAPLVGLAALWCQANRSFQFRFQFKFQFNKIGMIWFTAAAS